MRHALLSIRFNTMIFLVALLLFAALRPFAASAADMYYYTDNKGVKHFVQDPKDVPERYKDRIRKSGGGTLSVLDDGEGSSKGDAWSLSGLDMVPTSRSGIVLLCLVKSGLIFSALGAGLLAAVFLFGLFLTRAVPGKRDRVVDTLLFCGAVMLSLSLFWIAFMGPHAVSFMETSAESADRAKSEPGLAQDHREKLASFSHSCLGARDALEKINLFEID